MNYPTLPARGLVHPREAFAPRGQARPVVSHRVVAGPSCTHLARRASDAALVKICAARRRTTRAELGGARRSSATTAPLLAANAQALSSRLDLGDPAGLEIALGSAPAPMSSAKSSAPASLRNAASCPTPVGSAPLRSSTLLARSARTGLPEPLITPTPGYDPLMQAATVYHERHLRAGRAVPVRVVVSLVTSRDGKWSSISILDPRCCKLACAVIDRLLYDTSLALLAATIAGHAATARCRSATANRVPPLIAPY